MIALFILLSVVGLVSAVGVVAFKNPVNSALSLVANLLTVAGFFAMLEAHFLAAVQVVVYAGAIMVLVLFILLLLNLKVETRTMKENILTGVSIVVGIAFLGVMVPYVHDAFSVFPANPDPLRGEALQGTVEAIGRILFTKYLFLFQAAGLLLMVGIVGAVMLAKRTYRTVRG